jgi:kinesin family protein 2/24
MISCLAPGSLSSDHTLNTLRYADRIKEKKIGNSLQKRRSMSALVEETEGEGDDDTDRDETDVIISNDSDDNDNGEEEAQEDEQGIVDGEAHQVVQELFAQEEQLLSLHMQAIQQNAEYITEENKLMEAVQGEDYDMDAYALRLAEILQHKTEMILSLRGRLEPFRELLSREEELAKKE